jgi:hypothetical protein
MNADKGKHRPFRGLNVVTGIDDVFQKLKFADLHQLAPERPTSIIRRKRMRSLEGIWL